MKIERLTESVVAKIAAGEVVERPASVVKELLENAIDAGATEVHVAVGGGGRRLIRVSDNGSGIRAGEVELAFARHATSKLRDIDDLDTMRTLGFRGEALASISAVGHVSLMTCHRDETAGTQIRVEGGRTTNKKAVGAPAGTVITVENLFYNVPARLKFLKADTTEKRHITTVVTNYALAYPGVRFRLEHDGREVLHTNGTGALADVLVTMLGYEDFKHMLEVDAPAEVRAGRTPVGVYGYASAPDLNRGDRTRIMLFVNGRWVQDSKVTYAVIQAYHSLLMNGRYPVAVLMIDIPPDEVDVNVHPTKAEVRFRNPDAVFTAVQRAVRKAVIEQAEPTREMRGFGGADGPPESMASTNLGRVEQVPLNMPLESAGQYARQRDLYAAPTLPDDDDIAIPEGPDGPRRPRTLPLLRVVGQVGASYIVAEGPSGMYLVDQHAAHERILYEQFMAAYAAQEPMRQMTLDGQTVQLSPSDVGLLHEFADELSALGLELESFGPGMVKVLSVPAMIADADPHAVIGGIVSDLARGASPGEQAIEDRIVKRICKQVAVKAGQVLSHEEMQGLIRQLERCESPQTCPHGRPTILHMSSDQLAREFGRK